MDPIGLNWFRIEEEQQDLRTWGGAVELVSKCVSPYIHPCVKKDVALYNEE